MSVESRFVEVGSPAPKFNLPSISGELILLERFIGKKNVVLVFLRGFLWPFCRRHLEQLRQDVDQFTALDSEIVVIAPDTLENAQRYFEQNPIPFTALVDETRMVYQLFDVQSKIISLGQRPGLFIIDKDGIVRFTFIGMQQWEIPPNSQVLEILQEFENQTIKSL